ncbi:hypothetical protein [Streptomyces sp. NTH33]|uniref:hypothetical protein n=1 Tax=Streptomyces sp. NTH33 TaxID=1735453 RepID=UPI0021AD3784|nr:hypothetical protein [Streptomyces sp. NTH33]
MELRSVEALMDLLYACRGAVTAPDGHGGGVDAHDHALRTAALLRRRHPADKELQVAGLVQGIGRLLGAGARKGPADLVAEAVRGLLGERVSRLVRQHTAVPGHLLDEDALSLRQAAEEARTHALGAGVLEDWRTVLELVAARNSRPEEAGRHDVRDVWYERCRLRPDRHTHPVQAVRR